jgi:hypothetical protein
MLFCAVNYFQAKALGAFISSKMKSGISSHQRLGFNVAMNITALFHIERRPG